MKKKKIIYPLLAFIIPVFIMILLFIIKGGIDSEELAIGDMQAQHVDMLLYFKRILLGQESMFYSITKGLGGDMYSTMAYYMLSPLNIILLFFKDANIMDAIRLTMLIKIGLSGLNMYFLLNNKYKDKKNYSLMFALCYALMSFIINNYFCALWLDVVLLAPLVVLGIDKLINDKKVLLYMISLMLCIFTNFYFGYMICIFSVIYFVYSMLLKYKKKDKKIIIETTIRFLLASLLSGLAMAVIYIPTIISILKSDRTTITANETTLYGTIYRLFIGSYKMEDFLSYFHPCIYCGLLSLVLLITFLFNKKISEKEKVITFSIITLFIFSILFYQLSYIWHGLSYPIGYNFRFSFLFCLFVIMIAHKQMCLINKPSKILKYSLTITILLALIFVFKKYSELSGYISIALLIVYSFLVFCKSKKIQYVLLAIVVLELGYNGYKTFYVNKDHLTTRQSLETDICQNLPDSTGYRVAGYEYYGTNENVACKVSGTRLFSTTINSRITNFYTRVGLNGGINMYNDDTKNTPIIYSLLGVKYFYSNETLNNYKINKEFVIDKTNKQTNENFEEKNYIYENEHALKFGYMASSKNKTFDAQNPFEYQNELIKSFSDTDKDVLIKVEKENAESILDSKYLYFILYSDVKELKLNENVYVEMPIGQIISFENNYNTTKFDISATNKDGSEAYYDVYYLNLSNYLTAMNTLKNSELENININKNVITGSINVKEKGFLNLSIPYEDGFKIYVDDKEVSITVLHDFFMGVDLDVGKHNIKIVYKPKTFDVSLIISLASLTLSTLFIITNDYSKKKKVI